MITALTLALTLAAPAQQAPATGRTITLAANLLRNYHMLEGDLTKAAEDMSETDYAFKPTPEVRPFGQLIAHVALAQFGTCAMLRNEPNPHKDDKEDAARSKADLVALLKGSTEFCDKAFDSFTDQTMTELFPVRGNQIAKGLALTGTIGHGQEMYGTIAVYLRLKGIVPPTTQREKSMKTGS